MKTVKTENKSVERVENQNVVMVDNPCSVVCEVLFGKRYF